MFKDYIENNRFSINHLLKHEVNNKTLHVNYQHPK